MSTSSYKLSVKAFYSTRASDSNGVYKNHETKWQIDTMHYAIVILDNQTM